MRVTLSALMHDVQTFNRTGDPFTSARTRWMFGFQRRLFRLWENVTALPNHGFLPQISHTADMRSRVAEAFPPTEVRGAERVSRK